MNPEQVNMSIKYGMAFIPNLNMQTK